MQGFTPRSVNQTGARRISWQGNSQRWRAAAKKAGQNAYALSRPVNQAGAQGEEAGKGIANGGVQQLLRPELLLD